MIRKTGLVLGLALLSTTALAAGTVSPNVVKPPVSSGTAYQINPIVSNQTGVAQHVDRSLVNPWGLAEIPGGPLWINVNGADKSGIFDPKNFKQEGKIKVAGDGPTGIVDIPANPSGTADFQVTEGSNTGPSLFAFVTESGLIEGWNPDVDAKTAITAVDRSGGVSRFTGLSFIAHTRLLLAADFTTGFVESFDGQFTQVGHFTDNSLPQNYAPFNVRVIKGKVYVTFAERDPNTGEEVAGAGLGAVDVFGLDGTLQKQLVGPGAALNAPWGLTIAPPGFGQFANDLLVGNFGDGKINAYDPATGDLVGTLSDSTGTPLAIDGLWGLKNGPGGGITFAAGPNQEQNGLVGTITVSAATVASN